MRKIEWSVPESAQEGWGRWRTACDEATRALLNGYSPGDVIKFKASLYGRATMRRDYFFSGGPPFYGKCVYCESPVKDLDPENIESGRYTPGDVEHFRPKGAVKDGNGDDVFLRDHSGELLRDSSGAKVRLSYYWLAYDYRNLVPSCVICNRQRFFRGGSVGKGTFFPVQGTYAQGPESDLSSEKPLLINPLSENSEDAPEEHLSVDTENGLILPLSDRGKECVDRFGLNLRDKVREARLAVCEKTDYKFLRARKDSGRIRKLQSFIDSARAGAIEYSLAACAVFEEWRPFLALRLDGTDEEGQDRVVQGDSDVF